MKINNVNDYNNLLKDKLTMVIQTCDKFSDLWEGHFKLLNKNWEDRQIETLLVTDEKTDRKFDKVKVFSAGSGLHMPGRMKEAIDEIKTEYVLLTLDDYFPINKIDAHKIYRLIEIMEKENLDYIRLFKGRMKRIKYDGYEELYKVDLNNDYAVNLYRGIWRKDFLAETVKPKMDIWLYEVSLTYTAREYGARCAMSDNGEFKTLDVVRKGKLLNKAADYLEKHDLYHGDRERISIKEEIRIYIFTLGKRLLPKKLEEPVKTILRKFGFKFFSDQIKAADLKTKCETGKGE